MLKNCESGCHGQHLRQIKLTEDLEKVTDILSSCLRCNVEMLIVVHVSNGLRVDFDAHADRPLLGVGYNRIVVVRDVLCRRLK